MMILKSIWFALLLVVLIFVILSIAFFQPLFLRRSYIDRITRLEMPRTAQIIEYSFGVSSFGAAPFFAKLELSQEEYAVLARPSPDREGVLREFSYMQQRFDYESINIDDIAEIGRRNRLTSRTSFFLIGGTRHIHTLFVTTNDGRHFIYVFYFR